MPKFESGLATERGWVDPLALPKYGDASEVAGNAPEDAKQLTLNTLGAYGVGDADCFAYGVGRVIRITEMNVEKEEREKGEEKVVVEVVAEVQVTKGDGQVEKRDPFEGMLNGAGLVHGGCLCYLIDNCASFPLVALGVLQNLNGVGVTQALNVFFHSPASLKTCLRIASTSVTLGGRIMTSKCEITDKVSGRMIASALLAKMQPKL